MLTFCSFINNIWVNTVWKFLNELLLIKVIIWMYYSKDNAKSFIFKNFHWSTWKYASFITYISSTSTKVKKLFKLSNLLRCTLRKTNTTSIFSNNLKDVSGKVNCSERWSSLPLKKSYKMFFKSIIPSNVNFSQLDFYFTIFLYFTISSSTIIYATTLYVSWYEHLWSTIMKYKLLNLGLLNLILKYSVPDICSKLTPCLMPG